MVTRDPDLVPGHDGVHVAHSLTTRSGPGGRPARRHDGRRRERRSTSRPAVATHQVLTEVHLEPDGDAFYPAYAAEEWVETRREVGEGLEWVWLERRLTA